MARTLSLPLMVFRGTPQNPTLFGPFALDSFTKGDADKIVIIFTREADWPPVDLFRLTVTWAGDDVGSSATFSGVPPTPKFGVIPTTSRMSVGIPKRGDTKRSVVRGDIKMEVFANFSSAITAQVIPDEVPDVLRSVQRTLAALIKRT